MKKIVVALVLGAFLFAQMAMASLQWGSGANVITDFNGDPVATTDSFDPTAGAFAQLIRILNGTTPWDFVNSGSGIDTANEVVMDTMYSGLWDDLSDPGTFAFGPEMFNNTSFDGTYYVRVFDAPQGTVGEWNQGTNAPIPSGASYYFQSSTLTYSHDDLNPVVWNFGSGQTLNAIPEPSTVLLLAGGFLGIMAIRRKRVA